MNYTWTIVSVWPIEIVGKNSLEKRTVVLEEVNDKNYKGGIAFDLIKDKVTLIDWFDVGDVIEVSLNFRASEHNGRYYNNVNAWKIEWVGKQQSDNFEEEDDFPF